MLRYKIPFIILLIISINAHKISAQLVYNNGAEIHAKSGALFFVDGEVKNQAGIIEVEEQAGNPAEMIILSNFINNATAGGDGYFRVTGNWVNNSIFNASSGNVFLEGADQLITGSVSTYFNNLTLDGSGLKTQGIDQYCTGILNINHLELQTETFTFFVLNTDINAILRTSGFISSLNGGFLSRNTLNSSAYLFPVGSSVGTLRYRPVEITPENAGANTYTVRMANVLSTTEGYDANALPPKICEVNPEFYHQIDRTSGTAAADISISYDESSDGSWDGLAHWTISPDLWEMIISTLIVPGSPFNEAQIPGWNDFSQLPYILYRILPDAIISDPGAFCEYDSPVNLTAVEAGGTWSGTGITDAAAGTFDPSTAGVGTHTITYETGTGSCINTDNITITVNATPDATISDPGDFCSTDAATNLNAATAGGTWSGTGITDAAAGTFDPATAGAGTHTITYSLTVSGCSDSNNISIDVFDTPDATISDPGAFCENDAAVNLNATTTGGTWSGTGITDAAAGTFDPATAGTGAHSITYNVGTGTCTDSDNISITVNATPDATISDPGDFCSTDAATNLNAATAGGTWSGTGITDAAAGTFDPATAGAGTHTITYSLTVSGCSDSDNITIDVFDTPDATISDPGAFCENDAAVNLNAATTGGTWSGTGITDAAAGTFDPATAGTGTHSITYNVGTGTCTDSDNISITVNATPDATISDPGDFCSTDAATNLNAATAGGTWSGTGITDAAAGTFDPATAGAGTHTITYSLTVSGCSDSDNITIDVFDTPDATISDPGAFCENDAAINLNATTTGGTWSGTGITDAAAGTFDPATAGTGTHSITYNVGTGTCTDSDNISITVNATPDATISDPGDFCSTDAATNLNAATAGGTWSGTGITDAAAGTFDPATAGAGTHTITYSLTVSGCSDSDNISIDVFDTPDATIIPAGPFCISDAPTPLQANTAGGTWSGNGITGATTGTFDPTVAGIGTHTITYTIMNGICSNSSQINIEVVDTPDAGIQPVGNICQNASSINLTPNTSGGTWSGEGITDSSLGVFDPGILSPGEYTITYELVVGSCSDTDQINITVLESANANIIDPGAFCDNEGNIQLQAETFGGIWNGLYTESDGTFDIGAANPGTYLVSYTIEGNCGATDTAEIIIYPGNILVDYMVTHPNCMGGDNGSIAFEVQGGTSPYNYSWDFGSSDTSIVNGLTAGHYIFTVTDINGCSVTIPAISIWEGSRDCLRIPDAFTPNGDGVNDTWIIENLIYYPSANVEIFNRWGQLLYQGGPSDDPWDGTFNGNPVPTGSYIYVVSPKNGLDDFVGIVTIVR